MTDSSATEAAVAIWQAGVDAVGGAAAVQRQVTLDSDLLLVGDVEIPTAEFDRLLVVGAGKATAAMAAGLVEVLQDLKTPNRIHGWINVPEGTAHGHWLASIHACEARPAGVNEPTQLCVSGTERILAAVNQATHRDLCIVLLSGGGSALLCAPAAGVSLDEKLAVTRHLSAAGASITELNTVRKHLSLVKGGGLSRACRHARMITLVLSDVIGDPLDVIASGPTVADSTTPQDALTVLAKFDPQRTLPGAIYRHLRSARRPVPAPPSARDVVVVGNNAAAVDAAGVRAESLGFSHAMDAATAQEGTAESVGEQMADMAIAMLQSRSRSTSTPNCLITGGEPVVQLAPPEVRGKGGRNQQLVLAAMIALASRAEFTAADRRRLVLLSGGTDGEDGPTNAAGAILSGAVWEACERQGLSPQDYLARNDAYHFFAKTGGLLITGPTGTNVCDLRVMTIES